MPNLTDLQVSLFSEEDVTIVVDSLKGLKYLNNLCVTGEEKKETEDEQVLSTIESNKEAI